MILSTLFILGCTSSETESEQILNNLHTHQEPCSMLVEGKAVPPKIRTGACAQGETIHLTLHRKCPNDIQLHNNELGWWSNDAIFHEGKPPEDQTKDCQWQ